MSAKSCLRVFTILSLCTVPVLAIGSAQKATALPSNEVTTTFYGDAKKTNEVGEMILSCNGGHSMVGRRTAYASRSSIPCNTTSPKPPKETKFPCEFLQEGCSPIPEQR